MNNQAPILTKGTKQLLDQLVNDYGSGLPSNERIFEIKSIPAYIYNLFRGQYEFSYKQFQELLDYFDYLKKNDEN